ncbi:hypothetical protein COY62_00460 [bacterium (Candidatus Howlettbacteria) CG_4_10_14_0_8_um_filter_40_9]|nr:MAG: hypothetical protein COY62_00460 [bacterium (Candidatus Howlettbacteria) CG_4_10_14_0_8_um_filter_40_9]
MLIKKRDNYIPNKLIDTADTIIGSVTDDILFAKRIKENFNLNDDEFNILIKNIVNKYEDYKPLWNALEKLKEEYKLVIINNGTALTLPLFKKNFPINNIFELFVSSAIEGMRKPDKKIYLLTTSKLGIKPERCLFMDDNKENIETAKKLGMKTIYWENHNRGFAEFKKLLNIK